MTGEEYPSPSPLVFHSTRGPPVGQEVSSPVSLEMPSRCGPRNCGQSAAIAERERRSVSKMYRISLLPFILSAGIQQALMLPLLVRYRAFNLFGGVRQRRVEQLVAVARNQDRVFDKEGLVVYREARLVTDDIARAQHARRAVCHINSQTVQRVVSASDGVSRIVVWIFLHRRRRRFYAARRS